MFSIQTIQSGIYKVVTDIINTTTIPVVWFNQNAPRPSYPYITLNINSLIAVGDDYVASPTSTGLVAMYGNREFTVDINYFGGLITGVLKGIDVMQQLQTDIKATSHQDTLAQYGIAFIDKVSVLNITELLDTKYYERLILELRFRVSSQGISSVAGINAGLIESTEIEATASGIIRDIEI